MPARRKVVTTEEITAASPRPEDQTGETPGDINLWDYMQALPETEWQRQTVYLYQVEPSVTRKEGEAAYLQKFAAPFDEDAVRQIAPEGKKFKAIVKRVGESPVNFYFAMVPRPAAFVAATPAPDAGKNSEMVALLKDMMDKLNSGASIEQLRKTYDATSEIMKTTYLESLKNVTKSDPNGDLLTRLVELKLLRTGSDGGIMQTIEVLRQLGMIGKEKEDVFDQIEKLKTMGEILGWSTGGRGGDGEDWRVSLAKNLPDVIGGIERIALNVADSIRNARAPQGQPVAALAPRPANPQNAQQPPADAPPNPHEIPPAVMQGALDALIKGKLIEFYKEEIEPEEVVMWLELTAPEMVEDLKKFGASQVHAYFVSDAVLSQIGKEEKCLPWIEKLLAEMKAEPVGA